MKIVVTGALGHIGSALIRAFQPGDLESLVLLDDMSTQRYCSLFSLPAGIPYRFVEGDVMKDDLEALFQGADAVVHLAAITNATASFENQTQVERVNLDGTERVARACAATGAALIFLSTTSVYGVSDGVVDENATDEQLAPQSPYATSKRAAELMLQRLAADSKLRFVTLRFGTIYGVSPGMRFHTAINKFVWQACMGHPLTVWKTALHQRRPYLELGDAVRALRFFIQKRHYDNPIYNVLTTNATVNEIVERIKALVPDTKVDLVDSRIMNQLSYTVANEKVRALGFTFTGNLDASLTESVGLLRNARTA
jgi:nucleoside-diphosphate-sugar epimerase